jgi:hypothetical protein
VLQGQAANLAEIHAVLVSACCSRSSPTLSDER